MGQKVSSGPRVRTNNYGGPVPAGGPSGHHHGRSADHHHNGQSATNGAVLSIGNGHGSYSAAFHSAAHSSSGGGGGQRNRARSLGHVGNSSSSHHNNSSQNGHQALNIPGSSSPNVNVLLHGGDSDDSSEDGGPLTQGPPRSRGRTFPSLMYPQSLPAHLFAPALLQGKL